MLKREHNVAPKSDDGNVPNADSFWLRCAIAFLWLATGLGVLDPAYREIGIDYLDRLGLPSWPMYATCVVEVALGLRVALGKPETWITVLQVLMIVCFTAILACLDPRLLVHPFGILAKNVPLLAVIGTCWLVRREGWTTRAQWLLRGGMSAIWIIEGVFPKIFFQELAEWRVVSQSGWIPGDFHTFLYFSGTIEVAAGMLALALRGRLLRCVLMCQIAALLAFTVILGWMDPQLWVHPFGPLTKNVPILAGTWIVLRRSAG